MLTIYVQPATAFELGKDPCKYHAKPALAGRRKISNDSRQGHHSHRGLRPYPYALQNVLSTIDTINEGQGKVITVVGCGGNRDKGKRPQIATIAAQNSDTVILTSDNPGTKIQRHHCRNGRWIKPGP